MYAEEGWRPAGEPPHEEPPRKPRLTARQERVLLWLVAVNGLLLLIAPIGGATVIHAVIALLRQG